MATEKLASWLKERMICELWTELEHIGLIGT